MKKSAKIIALLASLCILAAIFVIVGSADSAPIEGTWVVGDTGYEDIADALNAAGGKKTVKLNKDITITDSIKITKSGRVDLNGHTITETRTDKGAAVFTIWYKELSFDLVGEGSFNNVNAVVYATENSTLYIEGRGSGISINLNPAHSKEYNVFLTKTAKLVTVKGDIIINPVNDAQTSVFLVGDDTSSNVTRETAKRLVFDGARITVNFPSNLEYQIKQGTAIYLVTGRENSSLVIKNNSYIDMKHGNFYQVADITAAQTIEEYDYKTATAVTYTPGTADMSPLIFVDIDDSVVHAYDGGFNKYYNYSGAGKLFGLSASRALVEIDNSELGGAIRSIGATYGYTAYTDSNKTATVPNLPTDAATNTNYYFTAIIPASRFVFNNVDYEGDPNSTYGSPWLLCSASNMQWNGGVINNKLARYSNTGKKIDMTNIKTLADLKAACKAAGLDESKDYYFESETGTAVNVKTKTPNNFYDQLTGDCLAYSEFTKNQDGTYSLAKEGDTVDHWIGVRFKNVLFPTNANFSVSYNGTAKYWTRPNYYSLVGAKYTNVNRFDEKTGEIVKYGAAFLEKSPYSSFSMNVFNPTSTSDKSFDNAFEMTDRNVISMTREPGTDGNGYFKYSYNGSGASASPYVGIKSGGAGSGNGSFTPDGGVKTGTLGATFLKNRYIVQEIDLATECGIYSPGSFQFVVRSAQSANYSTTASIALCNASVIPMTIAKDGTVTFDSDDGEVLSYSGKTFKLPTEAFDWTRVTIIYEMPGTVYSGADKTIYWAYQGAYEDLTANGGSFTGKDGYTYNFINTGVYVNSNGASIAATAAGKEHLPAVITDTDGVVYTYTGSYNYKDESGDKTITVKADLSSETAYYVTYMADPKTGKLYTCNVKDDGSSEYLDSEGNAYTGSKALESAKIVRADAPATVYSISHYRRAITRATAAPVVYAHLYIDGEWYISYQNIFAVYKMDADAVKTVYYDQLRFNGSVVSGTDILFDNSTVRYYDADDDSSAIAAAIANKTKPLTRGDFLIAPQNNYDYLDAVGSVDGVEYNTVERLLGAIEEGSLVKTYVDIDKTLYPDVSFTLVVGEGKSYAGVASEEFSAFESGNVVNVSPAYADEIFDISIYAERFGINATIGKAAYGTVVSLPEEYLPENVKDYYDSASETVYDLAGWTLDPTLENETLVVGASGVVKAIERSGAPAFVEWLDENGELVEKEYYYPSASTVASPSAAVVEAIRNELDNGWYDYGLAGWDKDLDESFITTAGETYSFKASLKPILPKGGVEGIKINLAVYTDFELNLFIPADLPTEISDFILSDLPTLSSSLSTRGDVTIGGVNYKKFYVQYGVADLDIDTYYLAYKVNGTEIVQTIEYGVPYYASAIMQMSDAEVGVKAKNLVMQMVNYASKLVSYHGIGAGSEGAEIYAALLSTFGTESDYKYLDIYESINASTFTNKDGNVYKTQIEPLTYKTKLAGYIKSASFYFSTETPAFLLEYGPKAVSNVEGIKAPNNNGFYGYSSNGVFVYFGYAGEAVNPAKHIAYEGGIENGVSINAWGKNNTVRTYSDADGNKYTYNLTDSKYYAVSDGSEYTGDVKALTSDVSYYVLCESYRYVETVPDGYHFVYNLLKPVVINVCVGNSDENGKHVDVSTPASGTYSLAAYIETLIEKNDTEYLDLAYSLYAYAMAASEYKS